MPRRLGLSSLSALLLIPFFASLAAAQCPTFLDVSQGPGAGPSYPAPYLSVECGSAVIIVHSNGIPPYTFVQTTPNALQPQNYTFTFPTHPLVAAQVSSVPLLGPVAIALNGLPIYGPNEGLIPDPYGDPVANALLDECLGHTAQRGDYHYHGLLVKCLTESGLVAEPWLNPDPPSNQPSPIVAYSFDGFPIYGPYECTDQSCTQVHELLSSWDNVGYQSLDCTSSTQCGANYVCALSMINGVRRNACVPKSYAWTNNQYVAKGGSEFLDQCNGHVGPNGDYHYHATATFPYILGCYRGSLTATVGIPAMPMWALLLIACVLGTAVGLRRRNLQGGTPTP
jgi:YHYH protein